MEASRNLPEDYRGMRCSRGTTTSGEFFFQRDSKPEVQASRTMLLLSRNQSNRTGHNTTGLSSTARMLVVHWESNGPEGYGRERGKESTKRIKVVEFFVGGIRIKDKLGIDEHGGIMHSYSRSKSAVENVPGEKWNEEEGFQGGIHA